MLKVVKLPQTIFLKIWRSDIDSHSPLLFLKVNATCILAIGFLNGQNCWKKWQMKAPKVKFTIAHLHKHAFCAVHKYFITLLDGRVLFVSYLPFNNYLTISIILQPFFNAKLVKKWVVLHNKQRKRRISQFEGFLFSVVYFSRITWISFFTAKNQSIKQIKRTDKTMTSNNNVSNKLGL